MPTIQDYINDRNKYKIDYTYQRPADAWSNEDNQCLIDTILRGEPIPLFFLNYNTENEDFHIVDGQQRLNCISKFYDNKIKLNKKFSGSENHGKTFNGDNPLSDSQKKNFLDYKLNFHIMEDYNDERVRLIFSRLQRGKPLQLGERLNAKAGTIVECMREIAQHPFMAKSIGVPKNRYGIYPDAARILFYEMFGAKQCGSNELYNFFEQHKDLNKKSKEYKNAVTILNLLEKCFPPEPGDYKFLEKHAWVIAVYTMIRELKIGYSLIGEEKNIAKFIKGFHSKVYNEAFRSSKPNYQRFYDNVRGGWSEKIMTIRRKILIEEFLNKFDLKELDDKRQITDEEKIHVFGKYDGVCQYPECKKKFKDFKEPEYHHKVKYSEGGKTNLDNIIIVCDSCHDKLHGKEQINFENGDSDEVE